MNDSPASGAIDSPLGEPLLKVIGSEASEVPLFRHSRLGLASEAMIAYLEYFDTGAGER